ncbi:hypothetical protein [Synechococcus sp. GFB01]|uniref:hypothetical protein n=1 Tax=Synechococcus sp. GFB01 TaxID=1662190 RepID=UPI00128CA7EA|nr:hypothetical protein [Synechococcus sp. GFB01]
MADELYDLMVRGSRVTSVLQFHDIPEGDLKIINQKPQAPKISVDIYTARPKAVPGQEEILPY